MKKTIALLALAALLSTPALHAADEVKEAVDQFEDQLKAADEAGKVRLIEALAQAHPGNADVAKALSKHIRDRSTAVAVAAIKALGSFKDKKYFGTFLGLLKSADDEPKLLEAALLALGELGDKKAKKEVIDVAKKWLRIDAVVASAAAAALGGIPDKESVDELIKLLEQTYPRASASGPAISEATRKLLADSRPAIMKALTSLTGWDFPDPRAWQNFWESQSKRWKPGQEKPDLTKVEKWEDPGYGFVIERPGDRWVFSNMEATRIGMSRGEENVTQAQLYVQVYDMKNYTSMTAEQKAQDREDDFRKSYKDIKEDSWVREGFRVGREKGFMHAFSGMDSGGVVLRRKNIFVVKDEFMYIIGTWVRSGSPKELESEVDKAIASFQFTL